jgi:8-oxo-dGTP pyrophosphatase MutT (NUDIX family)
MATAPRLRPAARAVVLDRAHRVLLVHFDFGSAEELPNGLWACPGGGIEPDESIADGLRRELREELGLEIADVGDPIWHKEHTFPMSGGWDGQRDVFYLIELDSFEPRPAMSADELQAEHVDALRWWTFSELQAAQLEYDAAPKAPTSPTFSPRRLGHLVADLVTNGRPDASLALDPL